jgi:hypothetical protein
MHDYATVLPSDRLLASTFDAWPCRKLDLKAVAHRCVVIRLLATQSCYTLLEIITSIMKTYT